MLSAQLARLMSALVVVGLALSSAAYAQNMARSVLGAAGTTYVQPSFGDLHFTVGEVATGRLENGLVLTEGFHQTYTSISVGTRDAGNLDVDITLYPNPTIDVLNVELAERIDGHLEVYDQLGRRVVQTPITQQLHQLDFTALAAGQYVVRVRDDSGRSGAYHIIKAQR